MLVAGEESIGINTMATGRHAAVNDEGYGRSVVVERPARAPVYFLLSSPRAGSTLLTRILDSHSAIASPCEICLPYVVRWSWKLRRSVPDLRTICRYYGAPPPTIPGSFLMRATARRHLDQLVESILAREQKRLLVIKDPRHARHPRQIEMLLADAPPQYIILHRDARAVAHSFATTLGKRPARSFHVWAVSTLAIRRFTAGLPATRYRVVRFEDVLADPAAQIRGLVESMGLAFEPAMLEYGRFPHADDQLNLWRNERLVVSVQIGVMKPTQHRAWETNEELLRVYAARPDIQKLNQEVGYT